MPDTYRRYEERDTYYDDEPPRGPPSRRPASSRGGDDYYDRREARSPPPGQAARRSDIQVSLRERDEVDRESRVPHFLRDDGRRPEAGPLVLRQRDVETVERARPRPRSPSPSRERMSLKMRARSVSPAPPPDHREEIRARVVDQTRDHVRSPSRGPALDRVRLGTRIIERPERTPSPPPVLDRLRSRMTERERSPSPRPEMDRSRSRIRITEREREREPTPSPSPPPPPAAEPPVIKGPTIEREVITHYRDIDHGESPRYCCTPLQCALSVDELSENTLLIPHHYRHDLGTPALPATTCSSPS